MKTVKIYTWTTCPFCIKAKALLDRKKVSYQEIVIDGDREAFANLKQQTGSGTVPQIFIDNRFIGGCDNLHELDANGQLDVLLTDEQL